MSAEFSSKVKLTIAEQAKLPIERIQEQAIINELIADSFALVEMMLALQEDFNLSLNQEDMATIKTIGDLIELLEQKCNENLMEVEF